MFIKGFDENLTCRGYQFEIGKTYDTGAKENLQLCSNTVFHFCRSLQQVHEYFSCKDGTNRFCEIEVLGELIEDEDKCGSNKIKIIREIKGKELRVLKGLANENTGLFNSGDCNSGDHNSGNSNSGNWNSGDRNSGDRNSGNLNTGMFNSCDYSTGFFNTKERTLTIFNKDSGLTMEEVKEKRWYDSLTREPFILTEWIDYTEEEKKNSPDRKAIGGYLKKYTFKEACLNWWNRLDEEDKDLIQTIPNFDKELFKEITGIEV